ncbi:uncharacterized protein Dere_GG26265 [Drosophila erecta]|uniref:Uncharacterized protein n=2 Tax=Drosophila erecta TaxID=7220 RepID=A0A0Q5WA92_DROER|nr:uncharacterized protein Dere_GG26265 [Drosophila erecta]
MRRILYCGHSETDQLKYKLSQVQKELDEANDFIAEIKFELDSVDILALQNQWLRDELMMLKAEEVGVIHRDLEEDPATRRERRSYRQQVSAGMVSPQLKRPLQEQRYGRKLDKLMADYSESEFIYQKGH